MWLVLMVRLTSVPFSEKNRSIFMLARTVIKRISLRLENHLATHLGEEEIQIAKSFLTKCCRLL